MALMPEFQSKIDAALSSLNLSDERVKILQPLIEKSIQFSRDGEKNLKLNIVDSSTGKTRDISIEDLVKEVDKAVANDAIPTVSSREKLTNEQLKKIAAGKLGVKIDEKEKPDKDAIKGSEILNKNISLESIASGKIKVDINS